MSEVLAGASKKHARGFNQADRDDMNVNADSLGLLPTIDQDLQGDVESLRKMWKGIVGAAKKITGNSSRK